MGRRDFVTAQGQISVQQIDFQIRKIVVDCKNPDGNGPSKHCRHGRLSFESHHVWLEKNHTHLSFMSLKVQASVATKVIVGVVQVTKSHLVIWIRL